MATRRGRVGPGDLPGAPDAATFRALDVPHVGPQRYGDKGAPFEQIARSLGGFSNALSDLAGGLAYRDKHALKDDYTKLDAVRNLPVETRNAQMIVSGEDKGATTISNVDDANTQLPPKFDEQLQADLAENEKNGWRTDPVKEGEEWITPTGPAPVGYLKRPMNPADIEAKYKGYADTWKANLQKNLPGVDTKKVEQVIGGLLDKSRAAELGAYTKFKFKERNTQFKNVVQNNVSKTLLQYKAAGLTDPDQVVKKLQEDIDVIQKDMGDTLSDGKDKMSTALDGIKRDLQNEDNYDLAVAVIPVLTGKMQSGDSISSDSRFTTDAQRILDLANTAIAKREMQETDDANYALLKQEAAAGRNVDMLGLEKKEHVYGNGKKFVSDPQKAKDRLAADRDADAMTYNGLPRKEPSAATWARVVEYQQGTSLESPKLKALYSDFALGPDTGIADNPQLQDQLEAYGALRTVHNEKKYIKDAETLKALNTITMLAEVGGTPDLMSAAQLYADKSEALKRGRPSSDYQTEIKDWFDSNDMKYSKEEREMIIDAFDYLNVGSSNLNADNVAARLNAIKTRNDVMIPTFNGSRITPPAKFSNGAPVDATTWTKYMGVFEESEGFQQRGLKSGSIEYERVNKLGGYYLHDKNTGELLTSKEEGHKGEPLFVSDKMIEGEFNDRVSKAEAEAAAARQRQAEDAAVRKGQGAREQVKVGVGKGGATVYSNQGAFHWNPGFKSRDARALTKDEVEAYVGKQFSIENIRKNALELNKKRYLPKE